MRTTLLIAMLLAVTGATAPGAEPKSKAPAKVGDLCKGAVDPYESGAERDRFFKAAGVDGELSKKECAANKSKKKPFVRSFESWKTMSAFDADRNGTVDWFEADRYRRQLRKRVLAAFDENKDKKLTGKEREKASLALAAGKVPAAPARSKPIKRVAIPTTGPAMLARFDNNKDGQISDEEKAEIMKAMAEQERLATVERYDADGDGELNEEERAALVADRAGPWKKAIRKWHLRDFDVNDDGEIDEEEKAAVEAYSKKFGEMMKGIALRMTDLDGDGEVSDEEKQALANEWKDVAFIAMTKRFQYMDANGDGQITPEERQSLERRTQSGTIKWIDRFSEKFDQDGDGRLNQKERESLIAGAQEEIMRRVKKVDANDNGRLDPREAINLMEDFAKEIGLRPHAAKDKGKGRRKR